MLTEGGDGPERGDLGAEIATLRAEIAALRDELGRLRTAMAASPVADLRRPHADRPTARLRALARGIPPRRAVIAGCALALVLFSLLADRATRIPVEVRSDGLQATVLVDGRIHDVQWTHRPLTIEVRPPDPGVYETGLDGADGLTLNTLSPDAMLALAATPYGAFDAWLRGQDGLSQWRDLQLMGGVGGPLPLTVRTPQSVPSAFALTGAVERLESPVAIVAHEEGGGTDTLHIDRSGRSVSFTYSGPDPHPPPAQSWYFPTATWPYLAADLRTAAYSLDWAIVALALVAALALLPTRWPIARYSKSVAEAWPPMLARAVGAARAAWRVPGAVPLAAALALLVGIGLALYVTLVDYSGRPNIVDTQAYAMQARVLLSGHTALALAQQVRATLSGPFFGIINNSVWAVQYAPGNPLLIAAGMLLGLPWLAGPLLDAAMLLGLWWTARRLFGAGAAAVTVALAALSPFRDFMVGTYMSHVPATFFIVLGYALLVRGEWARSPRLAFLASLSFGAAAFCRELSGAALGIFFGLVLAGACLRARRVAALLYFATGGALAAIAYGLYDWSITGDPRVTPRSIVNPSDVYGFGPGHGWWGMHTPGAGFVNLDQQLTGLLILLNGWPYYLSFALALLSFAPLLVRGMHARVAPNDFIHAGAALIVILLPVGYFYHGIVYGPRYVYEATPFLFLLQARGASRLAAGAEALAARFGGVRRRTAPLVAALLILLTLPGLAMVLPHQMQMYAHFNGDAGAKTLDRRALVDDAPQHAVVLIDDGSLFGSMLFSLNDPQNFLHPERRDGTVWKEGVGPADYAAARLAYPNRAVYVLRHDDIHVYFDYRGGPR